MVKFLMLPLGVLHVKQAVQRGIWVQTQHLFWKQGKPRKVLIELSGRRTFLMQTDFSQQSGIKYASPNIVQMTRINLSLFSKKLKLRSGVCVCGVIKRSVPTFEVDWLDMNGVFVVKVTNQVMSTYLHLKVRQNEEQRNWTAKHSLCYWMSNEPRITTNFYKLQWTPKFTDNERIAGTYTGSQEECARLREGVPYCKVYRYNPKHLCPKLNGYGDNGQRSLKLWQLLHTCWLPNTY
jgi:hypothetical protein